MAHTSSSLPPTSGSNSAFLRRYEFTYTGGSQLITLPSDYNKVYTIDVEGQGSLSESQYVLIPTNKIEILDELDIDDYIVVLYQEDSASAGVSYSKSETDSLLALKEDLTNKQDSLVFDGTGFKYPTIDVINEALVRNIRLFARTGIVDKSDNFELTILDANTIRIKACDNVLFWDKLLQSNISVEEAFKSFPVKDYSLTELVTATGGNINTNPITTDGIYVRYLGYDINGNVVSSPSSFVENSSVAQLGFTTVIKTGTSILFLGGVTTNGRNIFSQPILANLNDLDRITVTSATDITVNYNIGTPSLNSTNGVITGISINWRGTNNPNNTSPIDKFSYIGDNILDFVSLTPTSLNQSTPFTIHTLWTDTEDGIQINQSFFNTTTQLRDTLDVGSFGIKRVLIGIRGGIFIQESEFANSSGYATLSEARANVSTHEFTEAILPPGIVIEIARIVFKQGVTDFSNSDEFIITTINGGGGSNGEVDTVPDATTVSKGILKLAGDLGGTADLPTTPTALHKTGDETFTGIKSSNSGRISITNSTIGVIPIIASTSASGGAAIRGTTSDPGSYGVWGSSFSGDCIGVYGSNQSSNGVGVYGFNSTGSGGAGVAVLANSGASVTNGFNFAGRNNGVNTFTVNKLGDIVGNSYTGGASLTGTPTAPTAAAGTSTTQIATTAFVTGSFVNLTGTQTITGAKTFTNTNSSSAALNSSVSGTGSTGFNATSSNNSSAANFTNFTVNRTGNLVQILNQASFNSGAYLLALSNNSGTNNGGYIIGRNTIGATVFSVNNTADVLATSYVKSGATASNILLAGGGDIPQSTFQTALVNPITGSLTTGYLPKATGVNSLGNSLIYDNGTNVGIGTTTPSQKLEVAGNTRIYNGATGFDILSNQNIQGLGWNTPIVLETSAGGGALNSNQLYLGSNGNVGIGTATPNGQLEVQRAASNGTIVRFSTQFDSTQAIDLKAIQTSAGNGYFSLDNSASGIGWQKLVIPNGNVGIGTTNPNFKLDVEGDIALPYGNVIRARNYTYSKLIETNYNASNGQDFVNFYTAGDGANNATPKLTLLKDGRVGIMTENPTTTFQVNGMMSVTPGSMIGVQGADSSHGMKYANGYFASSTVDGPVLFGWEGGALGSTGGGQKIALRWNQDGNVGIGTTNPLDKLHISSNADTALRLQSTSVNGKQYTIGSNTDGSLGIFDQTTFANRFWIKADGNVGIGTTNPVKKVDILQADNNSSFLVRNGSTSTDSVFYVGNDTAGFSFIGAYKGDDSSSNNLVLQRFGGNVGIETTSPIYKLDVNGSFSASTHRFTSGSSGSFGKVTSSSSFYTLSGDEITYGYGISTNNGGGLDIMANQAGQPIRFWCGTTNDIPTERMRIAGNGNITINTLAGTGTRVVTADASGVLSTSDINLYKVYTAIVSQVGTSDPTVIVLENTLGTTITFSRTAVGSYSATAGAAVFTNNKTVFNATSRVNNNDGTPTVVNALSFSDTVIEYRTSDIDNAGTTYNDNINISFFEIRVYN